MKNNNRLWISFLSLLFGLNASLSQTPVYDNTNISWLITPHNSNIISFDYLEDVNLLCTNDQNGFSKLFNNDDYKLYSLFESIPFREIYQNGRSDTALLISSKIQRYNTKTGQIYDSLINVPTEEFAISSTMDTMASISGSSSIHYPYENIDYYQYIQLYFVQSKQLLKFNERKYSGSVAGFDKFKTVTCLDMSFDGKNIAYSGDSCIISVYNIETKQIKVYPTDTFSFVKIYYLKNGNEILGETKSSEIILLNLSDGKLLTVSVPNAIKPKLKNFRRQNNVFLITNTQIVNGRSIDFIYQYDSLTRSAVPFTSIDRTDFSRYCFSPDLKRYLYNSRDTIRERILQDSTISPIITYFKNPIKKAIIKKDVLFTNDKMSLQSVSVFDGSLMRNYVDPDRNLHLLDINDSVEKALFTNSSNELNIMNLSDFSFNLKFVTPLNKIIGIGISPDNKYFMMASSDKKLFIWETESRKFFKYLNLSNSDGFLSLSFMPNSNNLFVHEFAKFVIKDFNTGGNLKVFDKILDCTVWTFIDSTRVLFNQNEFQLKVLNLETRKTKDIVKLDEDVIIMDIAVSADTKLAAVISPQKFFIYNIDTKELVRSRSFVEGNYFKSCIFSKDNKSLIIANLYKLYKYDIERDTVIILIDNIDGTLLQVKNKDLFLLSGDRRLELFDEVKGIRIKILNKLNQLSTTISLSDISSDGKYIIAASSSKKISDNFVYFVDLFNDISDMRYGHGSEYKFASFSNDSNFIYYLSNENSLVKIEDEFGTMKYHWSFRPENYEMKDYSSNNSYIVLSSFQRYIKTGLLWLIDKKSLIFIDSLNGKYFNKIEFSKDGGYLIATIENNDLAIIDLNPFKVRKTFKSNQDSVLFLGSNVSGNKILSVSAEGIIRFWDMNGNNYKTINFIEKFDYATMNGDRKKLYCKSIDGTEIMYDIEDIFK